MGLGTACCADPVVWVHLVAESAAPHRLGYAPAIESKGSPSPAPQDEASADYAEAPIEKGGGSTRLPVRAPSRCCR